MSLRVLRFPAVREKAGVTKTQVYVGMKQGTFPQCIKLSDGRAVGWLESEIDTWIEQRVNKRPARGRAADLGNCINHEAEQHGANFEDHEADEFRQRLTGSAA